MSPREMMPLRNESPVAALREDPDARPDEFRPARDIERPRGMTVEGLRYWLVLGKRQWVVLVAVWMLVMGAAIAAAVWLPRKYQSTVKFLVRNARQDLVVNPNDKSGSVYRDDVSEETMNSELELLKSRDLIEQVVRESGLTELEKAGEAESLAIERGIRKLLPALAIGAIRKSNLIQVDYLSRDPEQAASVLRHLAKGYLALHLTVHSSPGTYDFFTRQTSRARDELEEAESELADLARSANLLAPEEQRHAAMQSAVELESQLAALDAQIQEQHTRALSVDRQLSAMDKRIVTQQRRVPNQASVEHLYTMLAELSNKRTQLMTKFNDTDRLVVEVDQQIANTKTALREAASLSGTEEATDVNPSWQSLQLERVTGALALAGLVSKSGRLREQLDLYRKRAVQLTEAAPRYETLSRKVAEVRAEYELYAKRAEEARVAEELDRQKISNVVLAEAPVPAQIPARPRVALILTVGAMAAAVLALAAALFAEWRNGGAPVTSAGINVYAVVPQVEA